MSTSESVGGAGDPRTWVQEHGDTLFRFAYYRLGDTDAANDAVQETLLAALKARHNFRGEASPRTWLVSILKNKISDHFRRSARENTNAREDLSVSQYFDEDGEWQGHWRDAMLPADWRANPGDLVEREEFWAALRRCLEGLAPRMASIFAMREIEEISTERICEHWQISPGNLSVILHRARLQLRRCLEINWMGQTGNESHADAS